MGTTRSADTSDRKNRGLRRNDDCGECVHAKHSKIADGESATRDVSRTQLAAARAFRKVAPLRSDLPQPGLVGIVNHRRDYSVVHRHRQTYIDLSICANAFASPACIHARMLQEDARNQGCQQIGVRKFQSVRLFNLWR